MKRGVFTLLLSAFAISAFADDPAPNKSDFTVIVMPEGDYLKDTIDSSYHTALDFLINVSHALDKRWTFYTEAFTTQSFQARDRAIYTLDEALTCALSANLQLDFGGNFSLNDAAPRAQLYTGLSQRF